jgi:hypothetical protein
LEGPAVETGIEGVPAVVETGIEGEERLWPCGACVGSGCRWVDGYQKTGGVKNRWDDGRKKTNRTLLGRKWNTFLLFK